MNKFDRFFLAVMAIIYLVVSMGCAGLAPRSLSTADTVQNQEKPVGYLQLGDLPDSLSLLPPPPKVDSAAFAADQNAYLRTRALRDSPRWALAVKDAVFADSEVVKGFACALNIPINAETTPRLYDLLRRSMVDANQATVGAKTRYLRTRPFVVNKETSCTPGDEAFLRKNGSYPSGHTTIGWTLALILVEIAPEYTDAILARGYAFGQSRVICGVHWQSDVDAGRTLAAGVVARLHANRDFRTALENAREEVAAARAGRLKHLNSYCQQYAIAVDGVY